MSAKRRIEKELKEINDSSKKNKNDCLNQVYHVNPIIDSIYHWQAIIYGPSNSPYENGVFPINIDFPEDYPFNPPKIVFKTKVFHPNISRNGNICIDILKNNWSPILSISKILLSISSLLVDPNPDDPLFVEAAKLYKSDPIKFNETARQWTQLYGKS